MGQRPASPAPAAFPLACRLLILGASRFHVDRVLAVVRTDCELSSWNWRCPVDLCFSARPARSGADAGGDGPLGRRSSGLLAAVSGQLWQWSITVMADTLALFWATLS